ncbi:AsnC family transcriptional regulator [Actinomadura sp. CNU-125]|nr:AsnC family transcriptional regulator [Actinomadura sp. CNU-125]
MPNADNVDPTDARILLELAAHPRAATVAVADRVGIARNTAQARLARLERNGAVGPFERRVSPRALGYPLKAFVTAQVTQRKLDDVAAALAAVPEILEVDGVSGSTDLLIQVVAANADDLYRIAGQILAVPGVERTNTALVMRQLVDYRITPLLHRLTERPDGGGRTAP